MLCVSLGSKDRARLAERLAGVEGKADLVEIRLDMAALKELDGILELIGSCPLPVIATNRASFEGGMFEGSEEERLTILRDAVEAGADFVDIELAAVEAMKAPIVECCARKGCRLIISYHDFTSTPGEDEIKEILKRMAGERPNIAKLVTMARSQDDVRSNLKAYCHSDILPFDLIAFSMGEAGTMSRLACLALGAPFTYVAATAEEVTAPGQLDVDTARRILDSMRSN